jgi:hypothetical protein
VTADRIIYLPRGVSVDERTCAGLALTASYWAVPVASVSPGEDPALAEEVAAELAIELAAVAAALSVRCVRPTHLPRSARRRRAR